MKRGQNVLIGSLLNMGICPWYRLQQRLLIVGAAGFGKGVQSITTLTISRVIMPLFTIIFFFQEEKERKQLSHQKPLLFPFFIIVVQLCNIGSFSTQKFSFVVFLQKLGHSYLDRKFVRLRRLPFKKTDWCPVLNVPPIDFILNHTITRFHTIRKFLQFNNQLFTLFFQS